MEEFFEPAFEIVGEAYLTRIEELSAREPWSAAKITALANAVRIAKELRSQIEAIVHEGTEAQHKIDHAKKIEQLTPSQRRLLGIAPF